MSDNSYHDDHIHLPEGLEPLSESIERASRRFSDEILIETTWEDPFELPLLDEGNLITDGVQELPPDPTPEQLVQRRDYLLGWLGRDRLEYQARYPVIQDEEEGITGLHASRQTAETDPLLDAEIGGIVQELFEIDIRLGNSPPPNE